MNQQSNLTPGAEADHSSSNIRFSWKMVLGFALMAVFLWLSFRKIDIGNFLEAFTGVSLFPVILATVVQFAAFVMRGWRWKVMLSSSHPELRRRHALAATLVGYAANSIIPRGGEILRAVFLKRIARTSLAAGLSSVLAERLLDLAALCVLFPLTAWIYQNRLEGIIPGVRQGMFFAGLVSAAGLVLVWTFGRYPERTSERMKRMLRRFWPSREKTFSRMVENFLLGLGGLFKKENAAGIVILSGAIWFFYILASWVMIFAFPASGISSLTFGDAAAITAIVAISFTLPSPGGMGTTHFFVSRMLIGIYAIEPAQALAYATLIHLAGFIPSLVLGTAIALFMQPAEIPPDE